jgi:hypothetical protein
VQVRDPVLDVQELRIEKTEPIHAASILNVDEVVGQCRRSLVWPSSGGGAPVVVLRSSPPITTGTFVDRVGGQHRGCGEDGDDECRWRRHRLAQERCDRWDEQEAGEDAQSWGV